MRFESDIPTGDRLHDGALRARYMARDPGVMLIVECVADIRGIEINDLLQTSRGKLAAASARKLAMYLAHVLLGRKQDQVARLFGRSRTTVCHACHAMEDRRDDERFEIEIGMIEWAFNNAIEERSADAA